jgi:hypothetical protein
MELYEKKDATGNKTGEVAYYDARAFRQAMIAHGGDEAAAIASLQELSDSEVGNRRDFMQMVVGGYRNGKNKVSWLSATTQERFNRGLSNIDWRLEAKLGREVDASEAAIISEINAGKYEAKRISELDPDELSRMIQILRDDNVRKYIGQEKLDKVRDKIITAQSSELYRDGIKDRERSLMDTLASYLYLGENDNPDESTLRDIETHHWQVTETDADGRSYRVWAPPRSSGAIVSDVDSAAPNVYSWKRQDDIGPSGTGRRPPR